MKAVVVEKKDGFVAVLSEDGNITKTADKSYQIGQVIEMKEKRIYNSKKFVASAAAVAVLFVTGSIGAWAYTTPYTYVSLDVNPSIEFSVNRFDQVINVTAVNDDGEDILQEINAENLDNQPIEEAIAQTVDQIAENGYFEVITGTNTDQTVVSGGGIVISTSSEDEEKADELAGELQEAVEEQVAENGDDVVVEAISVGLERVQKARELGVTPGKLNLVEKLQASAVDSDSIVLEEWLNKSVKEIMKATKENKKAAKQNDSSTDNTGEVIEAVDEAPTTDGTITTQNDLLSNDNKDSKVIEKAAKAEEKLLEKAANAEEKSKEKAAKAEEKLKQAKEKADDENDKVIEKSKKDADKDTKNQEKSSKNDSKKSDKDINKVEKSDEEDSKEKVANTDKVKDNQDKSQDNTKEISNSNDSKSNSGKSDNKGNSKK